MFNKLYLFNIEGKQKIPYTLRKIKGFGRRFAKVVTIKVL